MIRPLLDALERGALVVVANNRLARHLHLQFGRAQAAAGRSAWRSPAVIPWKTWIRDLWEESLLNSGRAGRLDLLHEQPARQLWIEIIAASNTVTPLSDVEGLAEVAAQAWQLMHDWGIEWADVEAGAQTTDQRAFVEWAGAYRRRCSEAGWVEAAVLPELLELDLSGGHLSIQSTVWFHGFDAWTPAQQRFRAALERSGVAVTIPEDAEPAAVGQLTACADAQVEIESAARWARARFEANPDAAVAVIVPDLAARAAEVRRVFLDVFVPDWRASSADQSAPVNLSYGTSLASVGVVTQALLALELTKTQLHYQDLGQLLRSPYLRGAVGEATARAALEVELRELADPELELAAVGALSRTRAPEFAALIDAGRTARDRATAQSPKEWCHWITAFLQAIGWPGDRGLGSADYQAVDAWHALLKDLAGCEKVAAQIDFAQARGMLLRMARQRLFQPEGRHPAVQVMGLLEASGQRFDHLWISGMAAEDWPKSVRPNAFLPLGLQRRAQLPDSSPEHAHAFATAITRHRRASADELVVSWPQQRDDALLSPSRLFADLPTVEQADLELWSAPLFNARLQAAAELVTLEPDPVPPVPATIQPGGGAGLLGQQSVCPARAFLERRLGAREIRIPRIGIDPRARGQLVHWVLHAFFGQISSRAELVDLAPDRLDRTLDELLQQGVRQCFGRRRGITAQLLRLEVLRLKPILLEFLELEAQREDFTVVEREFEREIEIGRLVVRLRLDRIDRLANGSLLVIDYKTGQADLSGWSVERPREPQMPAYAVVSGAGALGLARLTVRYRGYIGVGRPDTGIAGILTPTQLTQRAIDDWSALVAAWQEGLATLAAEFMAGDMRADRFHLDPLRGQFSVLSRVNEVDQPGWAVIS
jgi:probable DNA repair protein